VPEENFWTLWRKGRLTEADTPTIRLGATLKANLNGEEKRSPFPPIRNAAYPQHAGGLRHGHG